MTYSEACAPPVSTDSTGPKQNRRRSRFIVQAGQPCPFSFAGIVLRSKVVLDTGAQPEMLSRRYITISAATR